MNHRIQLALGVGLSLLMLLGASAPAPSAYSRALLLSGSQQSFRAMALIKAGEITDYSQALPVFDEPLLTRLWAELMLVPGSWAPGPDLLWRLYSSPSDPSLRRYRQRMLENYWSVRYLLTDPDTGAEIVAPARGAYRLVQQYGDPLQLVVLEKLYFLPRIYFRTQVQPLTSFDEFISLLSQPGALKPFDQVAIQEPRHRSSPALPAEAVRLHLRAEAASWIEIEAEVAGEGYLVLADVWRPGLQASVNDKPALIERANGFQAAVWLPAGLHQVRFDWPAMGHMR